MTLRLEKMTQVPISITFLTRKSNPQNPGRLKYQKYELMKEMTN
jgi:hypothetical protein